MPGAAWISHQRLEVLTPEQKKTFARVVPDFIIELKSPSDRPTDLDQKIREVWIANGVRMAWYIDPEKQISKIYRDDGSIEVINGFDQVLSGGEVLPGFTFDLSILTK